MGLISNVFNCDALEYMRSLPDKYFDLAIADPPYGDGDCDKKRGGRLRFHGGDRWNRYISLPEDTKKSYCRTGDAWAAKYGGTIVDWDIAPSEIFFEELFRVSKNQIIWGGNYFNLPPTRCFVIWKKLTISESFSMAMAEYAWTSFKENAKVFECTPQGSKEDIRFHPTQKPLALYSWLLNKYAKSGDKIFDPMMGSQSSRIAAYQSGYDYWGCEINKSYFVKGNERFDRLCNGIVKAGDKTIIEQNLFD